MLYSAKCNALRKQHPRILIKNMVHSRITLVILISLLLSACSEPTIDTSTVDSRDESIKEVRGALTSADGAKFDDALKVVGAYARQQSHGSTDEYAASISQNTHGKTGIEIIELSSGLKKKYEESKKAEQIRERTVEAIVSIGELKIAILGFHQVYGRLPKNITEILPGLSREASYYDNNQFTDSYSMNNGVISIKLSKWLGVTGEIILTPDMTADFDEMWKCTSTLEPKNIGIPCSKRASITAPVPDSLLAKTGDIVHQAEVKAAR